MSTSISENPDINQKPIQEELASFLKMEQLPAMPHSALTVLQLDNDLTKININDVVFPIEADPGLASQVLKFLNSAFFGFQNKITNIKQGIALTGIRVVKNFVLWKAVFNLIPKTEGSIFNVKLLWQDSLRRALFAKNLASGFKIKDPDTIFIGALLQDMAIPLLMKRKPLQYTEIFKTLHNRPELRLSELELEQFGWTHADAAAMMCQTWKIPEDLEVLIANHAKIELFTDTDDVQQHGACVAVALSSLLPSVVNTTWYDQERFQKYAASFFPKDSTGMMDYFQQVDMEFSQYGTILQISPPTVHLVDQVRKD